ncbi:MAG TPA: LamG domain-containing protein [Kofleriaceae bacterium]|nr:LamG domain-containing protein [Kofleriaceae bacterium]
MGACGEVKDNSGPADGPPMLGDGDIVTDTPLPGDGGPLPTTAALWLRMDDPPMDGALDSAGTHVTSCTSSTSCPRQIAGKIVGAYTFAGTRLTVAPASDLAPGTGYTLALWVRVEQPPDPTLGNATIAAKNLSDLDASFALSVSPSLVPQFYSSSDASQNLDGQTTLVINTWHHLAATWDGTTKIIYVDGSRAGSGPATVMPNNAQLGMTIGQRLSTTMPLTFTGSIDDLFVFNRALTAAEVAQLAAQ